MRVVICHNCGGFGMTVGPVLLVACCESDEAGDIDSRETGTAVYPCLACDGAGFLHVVAPS